jgi:hypothetical protein
MHFPRTAVSDWYWEGGPGRRFLVSLLVTLAVVLVPYLAGSSTSLPLIALFLGWDLGAWFMDKVYVDRLSRARVVAE